MKRQTKWKIAQFQAGNCINCGNPREDSPYKRHCIQCALKKRVRAQKRQNSEPWEQGRPGRVPLVAKEGVIGTKKEKQG